MRFTATLEASGGTTTGIRVPDVVLESLGQGKRPKVLVTFDGGYRLRTTVGPHDGVSFIPVSAAVRQEARLAAGDIVDIDVTLDTEPREVEVPDDLATALEGNVAASAWFAGLTDSQRKIFVTSVTSAKQPETRQRRVARAVEALTAKRKRP